MREKGCAFEIVVFKETTVRLCEYILESAGETVKVTPVSSFIELMIWTKCLCWRTSRIHSWQNTFLLNTKYEEPGEEKVVYLLQEGDQLLVSYMPKRFSLMLSMWNHNENNQLEYDTVRITSEKKSWRGCYTNIGIRTVTNTTLDWLHFKLSWAMTTPKI